MESPEVKSALAIIAQGTSLQADLSLRILKELIAINVLLQKATNQSVPVIDDSWVEKTASDIAKGREL